MLAAAAEVTMMGVVVLGVGLAVDSRFSDEAVAEPALTTLRCDACDSEPLPPSTAIACAPGRWLLLAGRLKMSADCASHTNTRTA